MIRIIIYDRKVTDGAFVEEKLIDRIIPNPVTHLQLHRLFVEFTKKLTKEKSDG